VEKVQGVFWFLPGAADVDVIKNYAIVRLT